MNRWNLRLRRFVWFIVLLRRWWLRRDHRFLHIHYTSGSPHWSWDGWKGPASRWSSRTLSPSNRLRPNPWHISLHADRWALNWSLCGASITHHPLSMSLLINLLSFKKGNISGHPDWLNVILLFINTAFFIIICSMTFSTINTFKSLLARFILMTSFRASCARFTVLAFTSNVAKLLDTYNNAKDLEQTERQEWSNNRLLMIPEILGVLKVRIRVFVLISILSF